MQYSIQYLRAVAAVMVVVFHCYYSVSFMRAEISYVGWLRCGVDIFFVVSGYIMVTSTAAKDISPLDFIRRRIIRIVPLYWIASAIMAASLYPGEWLFKIGSFFFLPVSHPATGLIEPVVQPGWTLTYEMFFYALFALTLTLREAWRLPAMASMLATIILVGTATNAVGILGFYSNSIVLEFLLGMVIAKYAIKTHWLSIPLGLAALFVFSDFPAPRVLTCGLAAAAIVSGFLSIENRLPRWQKLRLIGDASYAIYLFQFMALAPFVLIWPLIDLNTIWFTPLATFAIVSAGLLIHMYVEKPLAKYISNPRAEKFGKNATQLSSPELSPKAP